MPRKRQTYSDRAWRSMHHRVADGFPGDKQKYGSRSPQVAPQSRPLSPPTVRVSSDKAPASPSSNESWRRSESVWRASSSVKTKMDSGVIEAFEHLSPIGACAANSRFYQRRRDRRSPARRVMHLSRDACSLRQPQIVAIASLPLVQKKHTSNASASSSTREGIKPAGLVKSRAARRERRWPQRNRRRAIHYGR
jgi:hypothetical protein